MSTLRALIFGLLMLGSVAIPAESQRAPHKWWNELKSNKNADSNPSDDQLLTEASRLSSNLVRVPAPSSIVSEKRVQFDDQPFDSIGSESQFMRRSTVFESRDQPDNSRDRIWSYFDSKLNKNRDNSPSNLPETTGSLFSSFQRKNPSSASQNSRPSADDFFNRHFKRNTISDSVSPKPSSQVSPKTGSKQSEKDRILALDFGQSRRRNPEEKERWNQLIKTIFDSAPRSNGNANQYGNSGDYDFKSMTKTKIVEPNEIDDGVLTEKTMRFEPNEDVLKGEPEENISPKDVQLGGDQDSGNAKAATTMSPLMMEENADEEEGTAGDEQEDQDQEDDSNDTGARKRHATEAPTPMEQEEEDDEASNTVDHDEDNEYLRPQNKSKLARPPPTTSATTPATVNLNTKTPTRRQPLSTPSSESFGSRIHRSNITGGKQKPSFTMHFEMGKKKVDHKMITDLKKDPMFHSVDPATPTTTPRASTEVFDGVSREMMEEMDNGIETTTSLPLTTTLRPFKTRKSASGKWMDSETFKLNEDRSMIVDPEEDEEEDEPVTVSSISNKRTSRMSSSGLTTRSPPVIQKRKLQTQVRRKAVMANFRPVRQNSEFLEEDSGDELSRLSKALPGTPGQDYPILGLIPRTSFDCAQHEWPGYYADVDTQCQVFHICQSGGRRDSFLCPNGTMFNQQLFICDWWHNVKCQEVPQHYGLNQQIYDYQWESKRMSATNKAQPKARLAKRMGVAEQTTTTPTPTTVTMGQSTNSNAEQVWRRAQHLQGTKGRSRFGRGADNERNAIKAFFERYKYAQQSTTTEVPTTTVTTEKSVVKAIAASGSAPVLTFTTINDYAHRHPKHHRA